MGTDDSLNVSTSVIAVKIYRTEKTADAPALCRVV
jgi:hypothetical protein